jgi:hypothetical protein
LESADRLFVDKDGEREDDRVLGDKVPLFRKAQWKIVGKARLMAKETDGDLSEEGMRTIHLRGNFGNRGTPVMWRFSDLPTLELYVL